MDFADCAFETITLGLLLHWQCSLQFHLQPGRGDEAGPASCAQTCALRGLTDA